MVLTQSEVRMESWCFGLVPTHSITSTHIIPGHSDVNTCGDISRAADDLSQHLLHSNRINIGVAHLRHWTPLGPTGR